jgi:hypothetical protein
MVSFELLGRATSQVLLLLHPEQKHLIVDQAEVKKRSARREQHSTPCAALQLKLTHGALANQQDDWPRLSSRDLFFYACAHGAELTKLRERQAVA